MTQHYDERGRPCPPDPMADLIMIGFAVGFIVVFLMLGIALAGGFG